jgi:hypothetical protein
MIQTSLLQVSNFWLPCRKVKPSYVNATSYAKLTAAGRNILNIFSYT